MFINHKVVNIVEAKDSKGTLNGPHTGRSPGVVFLASLGVEINPRFYRGRIKKLQQKKNLCDIIVNGLATALLKIYHGGF